MKKILYITLLFMAVLLSCKDTKTTDQTPVANEPLDELSPDTTFNDIKSIFDVTSTDPNYNSFVKLINIAYMIEDVKNLEDVTLFAPTNNAVNRLTDAQYADLKLPQNLEKLKSILQYHIVKGEMDMARIKSTLAAKESPLRLQTLQGAYIALMLNDNGEIIITDEMGSTSTINEPDKEASNGVIHGISHVLTPQ